MSTKWPSRLIVVFDSPGSGSGFINPLGNNIFASGNADQTNEGQAKPDPVGRDKTFYSYQWLVPVITGIGSGTDDQKHSRMFLPGPHAGRLNVLMWDGHVERIGSWPDGKWFLVPL